MKNRFLVMFGMTVLVSAVVVVLLQFIVIVPFVNDAKEVYDLESIYSNSDIDFVIPDPTQAQLDGYLDESHIESISPFYNFSLDIEYSGDDYEYEMYFFLEGDMEVNPYTGYRLIEGSDDLKAQEVIIDSEFSLLSGAQLDDTVSVDFMGTMLNFTVIGIAENSNFDDDGGVMVLYTSQIETLVNSSPYYPSGLDFAGAYINSNDTSATKSFLVNNFEPLASKRDRSEFNNDADYDEYIAIYDSVDYSTYIVDLEEAYTFIAAQIVTSESNVSATARDGINIIVFSVALFTVAVIAVDYKQTKKVILIKGATAKSTVFMDFILVLILTTSIALLLIFGIDMALDQIQFNASELLLTNRLTMLFYTIGTLVGSTIIIYLYYFYIIELVVKIKKWILKVHHDNQIKKIKNSKKNKK